MVLANKAYSFCEILAHPQTRHPHGDPVPADDGPESALKQRHAT
jgi:hypothetical protein